LQLLGSPESGLALQETAKELGEVSAGAWAAALEVVVRLDNREFQAAAEALQRLKAEHGTSPLIVKRRNWGGDGQELSLYRVTSVDYGYGAGGPTTYLLGAELTSQVATREYTYDSTLAPSLTCSVGCRETRMREQFEALVHDVVCRACTRWLRSDPRHRSRRRSQASRRCPAPAL
jgi:hypothetical protein